MRMLTKAVKVMAFFSLLIMFSISLAGVSAHAAPKVFRMKIQSAYPHGDLSMDTLTVFADAAGKHSDGQINLKVFADPELVPGDQLFGATKRGVLDMLHAMGGMWGGMVAIGNVEFNLPLAFRIPEEQTFEGKAQVIRDFFFKQGFIDLLREEYAKQGLYFLDFHVYGPVPFVLAKKPLKTCDDLKGIKIRCEGINTEYHTGAGMQATVISGLETYMALKLGTVDAAEWDISAVTGLKWHEVAPYWIRGMECDHATGHILVSMKKWEAYPDNIKTALTKAAEDYYYATVDAYKKELETVNNLVKKGDLKVSELNDDCKAKYASVAYRIWDEVAAENPANAKAVEMIKAWRGVK